MRKAVEFCFAYAFILITCRVIRRVQGCSLETATGLLTSGTYLETQLDGIAECQRLCWYSTSCRSCSFGTRTGLCHLSKDTKDTNSGSFYVSQHHIYTEVWSPPCLKVNHPCTDRPCSLTEICVPIEKVTSYVCLHMSEIQQARTSSSLASTTAVTTSTTDAVTITSSTTASPTSTTTGQSEIQQTMTYSSLASTTAVTTSTTDAETITSSTTASPTATTTDSCIKDCVGRDDGDYQCCDTCAALCSCRNQLLTKKPCSGTLVWDNNKRKCDDTSDTCNVEEQN